MLAAIKAQKAKEAKEAKAKAGGDAGADATKPAESGELPPEQPGEERGEGFGTLVKQLNLARLKQQATAGQKKVERRRFSLPNSLEKIEALPFEDEIDPEWSPRGVAQDAMDFLEERSQKLADKKFIQAAIDAAEERGEDAEAAGAAAAGERASRRSSLASSAGGRELSPVRKMCRDSLAAEMDKHKPAYTKSVVHHVDLDAHKLKKAQGEVTLNTITTVTRRSQRALTAEEIALNCEKSINFFKISKEVNASVQSEQKRGGGWSKLRRKMLKI